MRTENPVIRSILFTLSLLAGGAYLFVEVAADIGGVLWLKHWAAEEELDEDLTFRTGRADPVLRNGVVYGVRWTPDFVSEPVLAEEIFVKRISEELIDFERSRWDFTGNDIDFHLKEAGGKVTVGKLFVSIRDYEGAVDFEMERLVATADGLESPLRAERVWGSFDTANSPPQFAVLNLEGVQIPGGKDVGEGTRFQGIPLGEIQGELEKLGYGESKWNAGIHVTYDRKEKVLELVSLSVEGASLARATLSLSLKDVSRDLRIRGLADLMGEATVAKIVGARLDLEDYGLVRNVMGQRASGRGIGLEEAVAEVVERWPLEPADKEVAAAFLEDPNWISVELAPRSPAKLFDLVALRETRAILRRLGFQITNFPRK